MERASHDPVSEVESFLNTISMMNIDINVENSLESFQQLKDSKYTIVDVAKP